jgi:predicted mannosyl-3-phosphoglycerate phosphatase (HAD superfamily)
VTARVLVFAELDDALVRPAGTEPAALLSRLEQDGATVILCSARTRAEVEQIQRDLGIRHPFVAESGSAAFVPEHYFPFPIQCGRSVAGYHALEFGKPYGHVVNQLRNVAARVRIPIVAFSDLSVVQVAEQYQVSALQARLIKLRDYTEYFRLVREDDPDRRHLLRALQDAGLVCVEGTRYHRVGTSRDFTPATTALVNLYRQPTEQSGRPNAPPHLLHSIGSDLTEWARSIAHLVRQRGEARSGDRS